MLLLVPVINFKVQRHKKTSYIRVTLHFASDWHNLGAHSLHHPLAKHLCTIISTAESFDLSGISVIISPNNSDPGKTKRKKLPKKPAEPLYLVDTPERSAFVVYRVRSSSDPALAHPVGIEHGRRRRRRRCPLLLRRIGSCRRWQDVWTAAWWRRNAEASDGKSLLLRCRGQENEHDDHGQSMAMGIHSLARSSLPTPSVSCTRMCRCAGVATGCGTI